LSLPVWRTERGFAAGGGRGLLTWLRPLEVLVLSEQDDRIVVRLSGWAVEDPGRAPPPEGMR
jgi:hypothetical protein